MCDVLRNVLFDVKFIMYCMIYCEDEICGI